MFVIKMARMMPIRERKIRKIVGKIGKGIIGALEIEELMTSPHKYAAKRIAEEMVRIDEVRKRRGTYRYREQFYNPKTKRFYVRDSRSKKILYGGRKSPYKNVRMSMSRKRRKR